MKRPFISLAGLVFMLNTPSTALAENLTADLSRKVVSITTGFTGSSVLFFGATNGVGDVIVVVEGPPKEMSVRRKSRVSGIWINRQTVTFSAAPSFYSIAASRPLEKILGADNRRKFALGLNNIRVQVRASEYSAEADQFRLALIRNMARSGLYQAKVNPVTFPQKSQRLFRTTISFPANVQTGRYKVRFYLVRERFIVERQTTELIVRKAGISAQVFRFAHSQSAVYGLVAILVAMFAGWLASVAFRRS